MSYPLKNMDFVEDLKKHIKEAKSDKYKGKDFDVLDFVKNYEMHVDHFLSSAIAYLVRYKSKGNKVDLLKAAHFIAELYEE